MFHIFIKSEGEEYQVVRELWEYQGCGKKGKGGSSIFFALILMKLGRISSVDGIKLRF